MKELIFLNFGNTSNYVSTHFWNLNDEMFKSEDKFNTDNSVLYDDANYPRNMVFDYSENIRPYFASNEKLSAKKKKEIEDEVKIFNKTNEITKYEVHASINNYLDLINDFTIDDQEFEQFKKENFRPSDEEEVDTFKITGKLPASDIYRLSDDKIYDYLDFQHSVKNWNDFLQPKFQKKTFNEIMTADVDIISRASYIKGNEFLDNENFNFSYLEKFEDNFRKFLEDCDRIELLHLNVDFNSYWGGLSNKMLEIINQDVPKTLKIIYGIDLHSSFYNNDDEFKVEKFINYLWYFTDLNEQKDSSILFMPIFKHQNPSVIKDTFDYSLKEAHDPVYDFYFSSICGANLYNLHMPLRSKYFHNSSILENLVHTTSSSLNFIESDTIIGLEYNTEIENTKSNGLIFNFSRNVRCKEFSWKNIFEISYNLNKFNSTIIHGYHEKLLFFGQKLDGFLQKHSGMNYTSIDRIDLPLSFPRKINSQFFNTGNSKKDVFLNDLSIMTNYRPFAEFPLKYFSYFPDYFKEYDLDIRKYLINHDNSKYVEYKEKIEEYYRLLDSYDFINEQYDLKIMSKSSHHYHDGEEDDY